MKKDQALAVICDLALTIGREMTLDALLTKVLQRFLFHTGYPVGVVLQREDGQKRVLKVIGDHILAGQQGQKVALPGCLKTEASCAVCGHLALPSPRHYEACVSLMVEGGYRFLLLGETWVESELPLVDVFQPVLGNLARAIHLCIDSEQLARRKEEALRDMQCFNQSLLRAIPIAVFYQDAKSRFLGANPAFSTLTGLTAEALLGKPEAEWWPGDSYDESEKMNRELLASGIAQHWDVTLSSKRGEQHQSICFKDLFYDQRGEIAGLIGAFVDISKLKESERHQRSLLEQVVGALASAMVLRDRSRANHASRVRDLSLRIGQALHLDEDRLLGLSLAAMVHDIGLIQVPTEITARPRRLSNLELELAKLHSEAGYDILKDIQFPWPIAEIVWQHHENIDGSGYPRGLKGDLILLEARIIRVADSMEAMLSHRPFRRCYSRERVIAELRACSGRWYDPQLAEIGIALLEEGYCFPETQE